MESKLGRKDELSGGKKAPRIRVPGGPVVGTWRRGRGLVLALITFVFAGALVFASGLLSSCSGRGDIALEASGGARVELTGELPPALSAKLRKLSSLPEGRPIFDAAAAKKSATARPGLKLVSFFTPTPDSFAATLSIADLQSFASAADFGATEALKFESGEGYEGIAVHLERGACAPLLGLLPGLDPGLLEALSPPALYPDEVTKSEYRRMLAGILGEKAVVALEMTRIRLKVEAPSDILASAGGEVAGRAFSVEIPSIDLLVLEKPVDFSLRWKK